MQFSVVHALSSFPFPFHSLPAWFKQGRPPDYVCTSAWWKNPTTKTQVMCLACRYGNVIVKSTRQHDSVSGLVGHACKLQIPRLLHTHARPPQSTCTRTTRKALCAYASPARYRLTPAMRQVNKSYRCDSSPDIIPLFLTPALLVLFIF